MIARAEKGQEDGCCRRHARSQADAGLGTLQRGDFAFQHIGGRVRPAGIGIGAVILNIMGGKA